jgi:hypothetical protein
LDDLGENPVARVEELDRLKRQRIEGLDPPVEPNPSFLAAVGAGVGHLRGRDEFVVVPERFAEIAPGDALEACPNGLHVVLRHLSQ